MRTIAMCIILGLLMLTSCKKDTEKSIADTPLILGDFAFNTDELSAGQTVDFSYNGNSKNVEGHYYYMVDTKAYPVDISFSNNQASVSIPDSAQAVAFNLKIDDKYDNNYTKGHLFSLKNTEGKSIAGSNSALANYVLNYGSEFGITSNKEELRGQIEKDMSRYPDIKDTWNTTFLKMTYGQDKEYGENLINDYISTLKAKKDKTENDYSKIISLYNTLGKKEMAEFTTNDAIKKFSKGKIFKTYLSKLFYEAQSLGEKESLLEKYRLTFDAIDNTSSNMARSLATSYLNEGEMTKFNAYSKLIDDPLTKASLFNNVAWSYAEKGEELNFASNLSKQSLLLVETSQKNPKDKPDYLTHKQYHDNLGYSYSMYADTYAFILYQQGNIKEAIAYQKEAVGEGESGEMNERYIEFLLEDEQYGSVVENSESFIKNGNATRKIKEYYKTAFLKKSNNVEEFDKKLAVLEKESYDSFKGEIASKMIEENAPDFTLKNMDGKAIALSSLKGKTVILDFWATWCGPCKASFPGMQEVVTKYKDDDNVVLLFVDTFEGGDNREKLVTEFIAKNKYDFHVVYDNEGKSSRDFEVADKYGVTGIPTKVIIDKNGKIRFKSVGYGGQTEKLVEEMDIMIDMLRS